MLPYCKVNYSLIVNNTHFNNDNYANNHIIFERLMKDCFLCFPSFNYLYEKKS